MEDNEQKLILEALSEMYDSPEMGKWKKSDIRNATENPGAVQDVTNNMEFFSQPDDKAKIVLNQMNNILFDYVPVLQHFRLKSVSPMNRFVVQNTYEMVIQDKVVIQVLIFLYLKKKEISLTIHYYDIVSSPSQEMEIYHNPKYLVRKAFKFSQMIELARTIGIEFKKYNSYCLEELGSSPFKRFLDTNNKTLEEMYDSPDIPKWSNKDIKNSLNAKGTDYLGLKTSNMYSPTDTHKTFIYMFNDQLFKLIPVIKEFEFQPRAIDGNNLLQLEYSLFTPDDDIAVRLMLLVNFETNQMTYNLIFNDVLEYETYKTKHNQTFTIQKDKLDINEKELNNIVLNTREGFKKYNTHSLNTYGKSPFKEFLQYTMNEMYDSPDTPRMSNRDIKNLTRTAKGVEDWQMNKTSFGRGELEKSTKVNDSIGTLEWLVRKLPTKINYMKPENFHVNDHKSNGWGSVMYSWSFRGDDFILGMRLIVKLNFKTKMVDISLTSSGNNPMNGNGKPRDMVTDLYMNFIERNTISGTERIDNLDNLFFAVNQRIETVRKFFIEKIGKDFFKESVNEMYDSPDVPKWDKINLKDIEANNLYKDVTYSKNKQRNNLIRGGENHPVSKDSIKIFLDKFHTKLFSLIPLLEKFEQSIYENRYEDTSNINCKYTLKGFNVDIITVTFDIYIKTKLISGKVTYRTIEDYENEQVANSIKGFNIKAKDLKQLPEICEEISTHLREYHKTCVKETGTSPINHFLKLNLSEMYDSPDSPQLSRDEIKNMTNNVKNTNKDFWSYNLRANHTRKDTNTIGVGDALIRYLKNRVPFAEMAKFKHETHYNGKLNVFDYQWVVNKNYKFTLQLRISYNSSIKEFSFKLKLFTKDKYKLEQSDYDLLQKMEYTKNFVEYKVAAKEFDIITNNINTINNYFYEKYKIACFK